MKVGVFDSGVGGQAVADAIKAAMPELEVDYREDHEHVPYGSKTPIELLGLVTPILEAMAADGCRVIVIACNSVTTTIISELRERISVPIIGIEPMIKPASQQTKSGVIAVCATQATLNSARYKYLVETFAANLKVLQPDCTDWAAMIEQNDINHDHIEKVIVSVCEQGADVIVLGCTHYHWIEDQILEIAKKYDAVVIQPEEAIVRRLKEVLAQLD